MRGWLAGVLGLTMFCCASETAVRREAPPEARASGGSVSPGGSGQEQTAAAVPRVVRGNLTTELVADLAANERARLGRYLEARRADLAGWDAAGGGLYVLTRLANVTQLHRVDAPLGMRRQITFGTEGVDVFVPGPAARGGGVLVADEGGSEYTQLYVLDGQGNERSFTDGKSRNESPVWSKDGSRVAYSSTQRNARDFDIWVFDATQPETPPALVYEASGLWRVLDWSPSGDRLLVLHEISETRSELKVLEPGRGISHELAAPGLPAGAEVAFADGIFDAEARGVYYLSDHGGEYRALWYRDLATGQSTKLSDQANDFERVVASRDGRLLALTLNDGGWSRLMLFDTRTRRFADDTRLPPSIIRSLAFSPDGRRLALALEGGREVGDVFVLDVARSPAARPASPSSGGAAALTRWTQSEVGGLDSGRFHEPRMLEYPSFDGRKIPALVYAPEGPGPHPVLVSIHGGPEGQSRPFFNPLNEYLVSELGIAVVLPNVRGSTGYGRAYTLLDNGERREDSVKDIGALLDWVATQPQLDAKRVGVYGGSYGGYMSLATGATFPGRVAAVVDVVGISNFVTFLESTKEYRRNLRRVEYGDERVPAMREFLQRISPLENSTKIVAPLLVAQGQNDPRVPLSEAEQIVKKLRAEGREVWFMLAADEGHGFQKKANRDAFAAAAVAFYRKHLLGGAPPVP